MGIEQYATEALRRAALAGGRVYPAEALKNAEAPFLFYTIERAEPEETLHGDCALCLCRLRVHAVAAEYAVMTALARQARAALRALARTEGQGVRVERVHLSQTAPDLHESEVNLFRRVTEAEINYYDMEDTDYE